MEAYVMIVTAAGSAPSVVSEIRDIEGVERANVVAGEFDVIADVRAGSQQALLSLITEQIQTIEGVGHTRTSIVLE